MTTWEYKMSITIELEKDELEFLAGRLANDLNFLRIEIKNMEDAWERGLYKNKESHEKTLESDRKKEELISRLLSKFKTSGLS